MIEGFQEADFGVGVLDGGDLMVEDERGLEDALAQRVVRITLETYN